MKIRETIKINASIDAVWNVLKDLANMPAWNPKCQTSDASSNIRAGEQFNATFAMNSNRIPENMLCKVLELQTHRKLKISYSNEKTGYITESFIIIPKGSKTKINHYVDLSQSSVPKFIQVIMLIISTIGTKQGSGPLDGIAYLSEES